MTEIRIDKITLDAGTQARASINDEVVEEYAAALKQGATYPPVVVFGTGDGRYLLADGHHRLGAFRACGRETIPADVREGSREDAVRFACGSNQSHGLRRSQADKRTAARLAIETFTDLSSRELAKMVGLSHTYINKVKAEDGIRSGNVASVPLPDDTCADGLTGNELEQLEHLKELWLGLGMRGQNRFLIGVATHG